ncbi:MAG: response regulator transcription factor [Anaerolineae bacterium]|nr:response regulator transcription factor [Anaerolineae bacterium]MDW8069285.1 response regulator transcription factor [Anaerolineae bacterium]
MPEKILVIDDDENTRLLIRRLLSQDYLVYTAANGPEGLTLFPQIAPDLVILDIMMPGMDGREVCRRLRRTSTVPILFLTALDTEKDIVDGLIAGGDDYLVKPFGPEELRARVFALLRRARMPAPQPEILRFGNGDLIINRAEQKVFAYGKEVPLSPIEYNLLLFMAQRAGEILSPRTLYRAIWGSTESDTSLQVVKWYIWHLRKKIEADPRKARFIITEWGKGYRFSPF